LIGGQPARDIPGARRSEAERLRHLLPALRADRDFIYEMHLQLPLVF
jgi:hypothetical protein